MVIHISIRKVNSIPFTSLRLPYCNMAGYNCLSWPDAAGMTFISMLTVDTAQNVVDCHLTGGAVAFGPSALGPRSSARLDSFPLILTNFSARRHQVTR